MLHIVCCVPSLFVIVKLLLLLSRNSSVCLCVKCFSFSCLQVIKSKTVSLENKVLCLCQQTYYKTLSIA